jgi:hypothetical protein
MRPLGNQEAGRRLALTVLLLLSYRKYGILLVGNQQLATWDKRLTFDKARWRL